MEESVVRASVAEIAAVASELSGKTLKVELRVEPGQNRRPAADAPHDEKADPADIVARVFRGKRVDPTGRGE